MNKPDDSNPAGASLPNAEAFAAMPGYGALTWIAVPTRAGWWAWRKDSEPEEAVQVIDLSKSETVRRLMGPAEYLCAYSADKSFGYWQASAVASMIAGRCGWWAGPFESENAALEALRHSDELCDGRDENP